MISLPKQLPDVGRMRDRVTLQLVSRPQDDSGEPVARVSAVAEDWALVEPLTSRELFAARQVQSLATHRVTMRYRAGVGPTTHRLALAQGGRVLQIEGLRDLENRGRWMELLCAEVQTATE